MDSSTPVARATSAVNRINVCQHAPSEPHKQCGIHLTLHLYDYIVMEKMPLEYPQSEKAALQQPSDSPLACEKTEQYYRPPQRTAEIVSALILQNVFSCLIY